MKDSFKIKNIISDTVLEDEQVITSVTEGGIQKRVNLLEEVAKTYYLNIFMKKNTMALNGKYGLRSKTVTNDEIKEELSNFKYMGCEISLLNIHEDANNKF